MSELKVHRFITTDELFHEANAGVLYYEKSEADKVIARHKYKRCLAMALLALEKRETYRAEYEEWCLKWHKRWLEIADQFKEAK